MKTEADIEVMRKYSIHRAFSFLNEIRTEGVSKKQENELLDFMSSVLIKCKTLKRKNKKDIVDTAHIKIIDEEGIEWIVPKRT